MLPESNSVSEKKDFVESRSESSQYGHYSIENNLKLTLPNAVVRFERISKDKYSYMREVSHGNLVEKIISIRTKNLEVEFVPTYPIHVPAYRTDFMFLRFVRPIFVSMKSSTEIYVPVPIENSLFFAGHEMREHVDVFACFPVSSRFGLYGPPENGKLCKFAKAPIYTEEEKLEPFLFASMKVLIKNELETGVQFGKIVFPVTNLDLYYRANEAVFDNLTVTIKERLGVQHAEIDHLESVLTSWKKAPRHMEKTEHKFSMEMGFD